MAFDVIVATDANRGIGKDGDMPWHLPEDLAYFKRVTTESPEGQQNAVIMGRKTWESIPERYRPLPGRLNIVVSRQSDYALPEGVLLANSLDAALAISTDTESVFKAIVVGGGELYKQALVHAECATVYITEIAKSFECDTVFPPLPEGQFRGSYASPYYVNDNFAYCFKSFGHI